jgi:transmembrane sensor
MQQEDLQDRQLREAAEWLSRLSCTTPSEADVRDWLTWSAANPQSAATFDELEKVWNAAKVHPPSAHAIRELLKPSERGRTSGLHNRWRRPWSGGSKLLQAIAVGTVRRRWSTVVAILAAASLAGSAWFLARTPQSGSLASARAQDRAFMLADGSEVDIGGLTAVHVQLTRQQRLLTLLNGEAYFQDKHHVAWPFVVSAADALIVARGTAFDVERFPHRTVVSVVSGIVDVSFPRRESATLAEKATRTASASQDLARSTGSRQTFELTAGEQMVMFGNGEVVRNEIDPDSAIAWRQGRLEFPDAPLGGVVEDVNRYARRPIRITDERIASLHFTGTVFLQSIDQWVGSLPLVFPVVVDTSSPKFIALRLR